MNKQVFNQAFNQACRVALVALLASPALTSTAHAQAATDIDALRQQVERLNAEVDYLKENAKVERKDIATKAVTLDTLSAAANKFTWSGDFRFREELISRRNDNTTPEHTQNRDRIRMRLGLGVKVNDTVNAKFQLATIGGTGDPRSTNQTLGEGWTRKGIAIDQAYVDWKATSFMNVQLGKTPIPWTTTASYFWDKDLSPEGAAVKFSKDIFFGGLYYDWLNERSSFAPTGARSDSKLTAAQFGIKQPLGKNTLTVAIGYFNTTNVKGEVVAAGTGCTATANTTFFGASANGNSTTTTGGCTTLNSDFTNWNALVQFDFFAGKYPMSAFADYMTNKNAEVNTTANKKLKNALAMGVTFNKASAPKSWEVALVYQKTGKDSVFGQFVDSDFAAGATDGEGLVLKGAFVPATNWTLNATYFDNKLNNEGVAATAVTTRDLKYKRVQLDLNYKF